MSLLPSRKGGPLPRRVLVDEVYDAVTAMLLQGAFGSYERISIDVVARELDVSATPVREALARLESEGLVVKQALRGYTAAPVLDQQGVEDLFDLRMLLEPHAARRAAVAATPAEIERLRDRTGAFAASVAHQPEELSVDAYLTIVEHDIEFHNAIAQLSGNALLAEEVRRLRPHMHLYRLIGARPATKETVDEHEAILAAIVARDSAAAEQAMAEHVRQALVRAERHLH